MQFAKLWSWQGTLTRGQYALIGVLGVAIKHNLDRFLAFVFHQPWNFWGFWIPVTNVSALQSLSSNQKIFLYALLLSMIPFIWIGLASTVRRLRDAGQPLWLSIFFFAPFLNVVFFAILCGLPGSSDSHDFPLSREKRVSRFWPRSRWGSATLAVVATNLVSVLFVYVSVTRFGSYAWAVFVACPFVMGYLSVWIYCRREPRSFSEVVAVVSCSVGLVSFAIVGAALEGIVCVVMALPILWIMAMIGGILAHALHNNNFHATTNTGVLGLALLSLPAILGIEQAAPPPVPRFQVHTSIEIAAPPEIVWRHIISFPQLPPPAEWPFRIGISYPLEARITGEGLTADRECRFSTGSFKEPILAWEPAHHFAFSVAEEPLLMKETSPYGNIRVRHLEDHDFQPERADFYLTRLPNGGTRLDGVTTYRNKMWPGIYWRLWTDQIVHAIHTRVFQHVKQLSEEDVQAEQ